jgi:hypothetical protein
MALHDEFGQVIFTACQYLEHRSGSVEAKVRACVEGLV